MSFFNVMSCNILSDLFEDRIEYKWTNRRNACIKIINKCKPDVIGFQEVRGEQKKDLVLGIRNNTNSKYFHFGLPDYYRDAWDIPNPIFVNTMVFDVVLCGGYSLSETPNVLGINENIDDDCSRHANWIILRHKKTNKQMRMINTHLHPWRADAQLEQVKIIQKDVEKYSQDFLQILIGDLNCNAQSSAMSYLLEYWNDTYFSIYGDYNPCDTRHNFLGDDVSEQCGKIDWILTRGQIKSILARIIKDRADKVYPSDHYFVFAKLSI